MSFILQKKTYGHFGQLSKINLLILHLRILEKEEQIKARGSRRKEIIKIRSEIHESENRKSTGKTQQNPNPII